MRSEAQPRMCAAGVRSSFFSNENPTYVRIQESRDKDEDWQRKEREGMTLRGRELRGRARANFTARVTTSSLARSSFPAHSRVRHAPMR